MKKPVSRQEHREIHGCDPHDERSCPVCQGSDWAAVVAVIVVLAVILGSAVYFTTFIGG